MKRYIPQLFVILIIVYLLFLIRPAISGQLTGTFKPHSIPREYIRFDQFLNNQKQFFRTFWVPTVQRFGFYSSTHPAIYAYDFFNVTSLPEVIDELEKPTAENILQDAGVKYIIVPYDSQGEIFLTNGKYNNNLYLEAVKKISKISWLRRIKNFGKIVIFQVPNPKDHFWSTSKNLVLNYKYISPAEYKVNVRNAVKGEKLIFSESYDPNWIARYSKLKIKSSEFAGRFNSFVLTLNGSYTLDIYYYPQVFVNIGLVISAAAFITCILLLIFLKNKKL